MHTDQSLVLIVTANSACDLMSEDCASVLIGDGSSVSPLGSKYAIGQWMFRLASGVQHETN